MRLSTILPVLLAVFTSVTMAQMPNNISNNGIGSSPAQRHYISACQAQSILLAAQSAATALGVSDNIAVLDLSGFLVGFLRMDNAFLGGIELSIKKAKTVVLFNGLTSTELYPASLPNGTLYGLQETNGGLVVFPGGLPLFQDDHLIGAIGVSGGTIAQDAGVAQAGVDHFVNSGYVC